MTTALVLSELIRQDGYVSGGALAKKAGVSRNAVWKAVERMRGDGYEIEAVPRLGYRLVSAPDSLRDYDIAAHLLTTEIGLSLHCLDSVDSTNLFAKRVAREGAPHGALIVSDEQTAGRGRLGRMWESQPGIGLYFSLVLRPELPPADAPQLTTVAAVSIARVLRDGYSVEARLKWPNDILVHGRKICGILVEMSCDLDRIHHIILGVGINVHRFVRDPGSDVSARAIALDEVTRSQSSRVRLLASVLDSIETYYRKWLSCGFSPILTEAKSLSCTLGQRVAVSTPAGVIEGVARDIDLSGALVVEEPTGVSRKIYAGDVAE